MPEQARILQFRGRASTRKSPGDASAAAESYLSQDAEYREGIDIDGIYADLDVLMAICAVLRERFNSNPSDVLVEANRIFEWVSRKGHSIGYFDERDFFLGESALLAGTASRLLGQRSETELWLDRADASYRHTINPAASLARVAFVRLALRYDAGRFSDILELLPSVALTFEKLKLYPELGKCHYLEAMCYKEMGRVNEAKSRLQCLISGPEFQLEPALRGLALMNIGNMRSQEGDHKEALTSYRAAQPLLESSKRYAALADLKAMVGETLDLIGQTSGAIEAYRESVADHVQLGMVTRAAYFRVVLSEALLGCGRAREAEWELLAALPTINEQKMVPEGFAAVALLQQSVRLRKTDPAALTELRKYLQAAN